MDPRIPFPASNPIAAHVIKLRRCVSYQNFSTQELVHVCTTRVGDVEAWREFTHRFHRLIAGVALRTARRHGEVTPALLEDLVQETYLKLCADRCQLLRSFNPEHPDAIFGFLKVLTANVVHDYFRAANAQKRGAGQERTEILDADVAPYTGSPRDMGQVEHGILLSQIDDVLRTRIPEESSQRDRTIFWLYYRQGLSARAIALIPSIGLTPKGVESTILRLTRLVRDVIVRPAPTLGTSEKGFTAEGSFS
jgi:RNA polymerase sigma-70 factor (ECF subfamily)